LLTTTRIALHTYEQTDAYDNNMTNNKKIKQCLKYFQVLKIITQNDLENKFIKF